MKSFKAVACVILILVLLVSIVRADLVANWTFDEGSGGYANDSTIFGNNCTLNNASWVTGIQGDALDFNGFDSYLNCGNDTSLNFGADNFTIMAWVKYNSGVDGGVVGKNLYVDVSAGGMEAVANLTFTRNETEYQENIWQHIAVTRVGDVLKLYVNGLDVGEAGGEAYIGDVNSIASLGIGVDNLESPAYFSGTIDEVKMWNVAKDASFISQIYSEENPYYITGCTNLDVDNQVYYLVTDIINSTGGNGVTGTICMHFNATNVTLDCQNHIIDGNWSGTAIYASSIDWPPPVTSNNATIKNCIITDWGTGIDLTYTNSHTLTNLTLANNSYGILIFDGDGLTFSNINITNSSAGYAITLNGISGIHYPKFSNIDIQGGNAGIQMEEVYNGKFTNITINSVAQDAIKSQAVSNSFTYVKSNNFTNMTITNNGGNGIYFTSFTQSNIINNSIIQNNGAFGVNLESGFSNVRTNSFYNNLINNINNTQVNSYTNYWNTGQRVGTPIYGNGAYIGGNFWTHPSQLGYSNICTDTNQNGFCDSPYTLASHNVDNFPLVFSYNFTPLIPCLNITTSGTTTLTENLSAMNTTCANFTIADCRTHNACSIPTGCEAFNQTQCGNDSNCVWNSTYCDPAVCVGTFTDYPEICVDIPANNVILDCAGYSIIGALNANPNFPASYGIRTYHDTPTATNVTIKNCTVSNFSYAGIYFENVSNSSIVDTNVTDNFYAGNCLGEDAGGIGILFRTSPYNNLTNIVATNNNVSTQCGASGIDIYDSNFNILTNINSTSNAWYGLYLSNSNFTMVNDANLSNNFAAGLYLFSSGSGTFTNIYADSNNNTFTNGGDGIDLDSSSNNSFTNITANSNTAKGLYFVASPGNTFINLTANNNSIGTKFESSSDYNVLTNITTNSNGGGVGLDDSSNNIFSNLSANLNSDTGVSLTGATGAINNTVHYSIIQDNAGQGFYIGSLAASNPFYNNLINNSINIVFEGAGLPNYWNTTKQNGTRIYSAGTQIGGNYWTANGTGYSDTCTDSNRDGFCDSPYDALNDIACTAGINCSNNTDYLPLAKTKTNTTLTLTASIGWSIPKGYSDTLTCTANNNESSPLLYVSGANKSNPYTFTPSASVTTICNSTETTNYYAASVNHTLTVTMGGGGGYTPPGGSSNETQPPVNQTNQTITLPWTERIMKNAEKIINSLPFLTEEEKKFILAFFRAIYDFLIATILGIPIYFIIIILSLIIFLASVIDKGQIRTWKDIPTVGIICLFVAAFLGILFFLGPLVEV